MDNRLFWNVWIIQGILNNSIVLFFMLCLEGGKVQSVKRERGEKIEGNNI